MKPRGLGALEMSPAVSLEWQPTPQIFFLNSDPQIYRRVRRDPKTGKPCNRLIPVVIAKP